MYIYGMETKKTKEIDDDCEDYTVLSEVVNFEQIDKTEKHDRVMSAFYKRFSWDVETVMTRAAQGFPVRQLCKDYHIAPSTFYHAKRQLLELENTQKLEVATHVNKQDLPNPLKLAENMGAGMEKMIEKGLELLNSYVIMVEVAGPKGISYEAIPVNPENINWKEGTVYMPMKRYTGHDTESMDADDSEEYTHIYSTKDLVPEQKIQLEAFKALTKATGMMNLGQNMARVEAAVAEDAAKKKIVNTNKNKILHSFPGNKVAIEAEVVEEEVTNEKTNENEGTGGDTF